MRYRSVSAGSALGFVLGITLLGTLITLPQFVQGSLGFTATLSGELLVMRALPVLIFTPLGAFLASKVGVDPRLQIGLGFVCIGVSNFLLARATTSESDFLTFGLSLVLSGIGLSQVFVPLTLVVFGTVPPQDAPKASAFFNLSRQLGGSLATAVLIALLDRSQDAHQTRLAADTNLSRPVVRSFVERDGAISPAARSQIAGLVSSQALVLAYADVSSLVGIATLALAPLSLLLAKPKKPAEH